ncbi:hypothetical protein [Nocardia sp. NBC_00511]|uniref:hypothetical protein n=1 Tax=Nocardia sp. NBC_00511 TaxID=2903591 RepID=UPI0030E0A7CA
MIEKTGGPTVVVGTSVTVVVIGVSVVVIGVSVVVAGSVVGSPVPVSGGGDGAVPAVSESVVAVSVGTGTSLGVRDASVISTVWIDPY